MKMRLATVFAGTLMTLAFAACDAPIVPHEDTVTIPPQVTLDSYLLQGEVRVIVPPVDFVGPGQLHAVIQVRNVMGYPLKLAHQDWFVDQKGAMVQDKTAKIRFTIGAHDTFQYEVTSMTPMARDFRTHIYKDDVN